MGKPLRTSGANEIDSPPSENQSCNTTKYGEEETFAKKLSHNQSSASTERRSDSNFRTTRCCARKEEISDVSARDEKDHRHSTEENHYRWTHFTDYIGMQSHHCDTCKIQVRVRILPGESICDCC